MNYWDTQASEQGVLSAGDRYDEITADQLMRLSEDISAYDQPRVLEFGCGIGRLLVPLADRFDGEFCGVDSSEQMLAKVPDHERVSTFLISDDDFRHVGGIHYAYSVLVFQHLSSERVRRVIDQIGDLLEGGGRVLFQFVKSDEPRVEGEFSHFHTLDQIEGFCWAAGINVDGFHHDEIYPNWVWVYGEKM